jgi:hypothetical protein
MLNIKIEREKNTKPKNRNNKKIIFLIKINLSTSNTLKGTTTKKNLIYPHQF